MQNVCSSGAFFVKMVLQAGAKFVLIRCCFSVTMVLIATARFLGEREREREKIREEKRREEKRRGVKRRGEEKREFEVDVCMVDGRRM